MAAARRPRSLFKAEVRISLERTTAPPWSSWRRSESDQSSGGVYQQYCRLGHWPDCGRAIIPSTATLVSRIARGEDFAASMMSIPIPQTYALLLFCAAAALISFSLKKRNDRISQEISHSLHRSLKHM